MGTVTSCVIAGKRHPYHEGVIPWAYLELTENDVAVWELKMERYGQHLKVIMEAYDPDTIMEDMMLLVALYVVGDEKVVSLITGHLHDDRRLVESFLGSLKWARGEQEELKEERVLIPAMDLSHDDVMRLIRRRNYWDFGLYITMYRGATASAWKSLELLRNYKIGVKLHVEIYHRVKYEGDRRIYEAGIVNIDAIRKIQADVLNFRTSSDNFGKQ